MALRGSASRRSPMGALAGTLRDLDRRSRTMANSRRALTGSEGPAGPQGDPGPRGARGAAGPSPHGAVVTTGEDGRATWTVDHDGVLAVAATPVQSDGGDARPVHAVLESVTAGQVTVRVWQAGEPAAGVVVHLVAALVAGPRLP